MENKHEICKLLLKTLQKTRNCRDLVSLEFNERTEIVTATFTYWNPDEDKYIEYTKKINVAMDSGTAMIRDITKNIEN